MLRTVPKRGPGTGYSRREMLCHWCLIAGKNHQPIISKKIPGRFCQVHSPDPKPLQAVKGRSDQKKGIIKKGLDAKTLGSRQGGGGGYRGEKPAAAAATLAIAPLPKVQN